MDPEWTPEWTKKGPKKGYLGLARYIWPKRTISGHIADQSQHDVLPEEQNPLRPTTKYGPKRGHNRGHK